jgi:hypothetical protein
LKELNITQAEWEKGDNREKDTRRGVGARLF